ncbi:MAG TPA: RidA family protein [Chloroflexota bacterium]|nr:RidA family protein [Chloroflexota bacterium]
MASEVRKRAVNPPGVPAPPSPHMSASVWVAPGPLVFLSGQVARDLERNVVGRGDVRAQTRQALEHIRTILQAHGATLQDVVKLTVYLTDMTLAGATAEVRREYWPTDGPASTLVAVSALGDPDILVEIDVIAAPPGGE